MTKATTGRMPGEVHRFIKSSLQFVILALDKGSLKESGGQTLRRGDLERSPPSPSPRPPLCVPSLAFFRFAREILNLIITLRAAPHDATQIITNRRLLPQRIIIQLPRKKKARTAIYRRWKLYRRGSSILRECIINRLPQAVLSRCSLAKSAGGSR